MSTRAKRPRREQGIRTLIPSTPIDFSNCENWAKCTDQTDGEHMFSYRRTHDVEDSFGYPGGKKEICAIYNRICWNNSRMASVIEASNWHHMVSVMEKDHDRSLAYALMERWWHTTHTFHLPMLEVGFTPVDFTSLTGVPVGVGNLVPWEDFGSDDIKAARVARATELLPDVDDLMETDAKGISCSSLKSWFKDQVIPEVIPGEDYALTAVELQMLRAFFLLVLGEIWFPMSKKFVSCELIGAVEDVHQVGTYDWGSAIMANMYYSLDRMAQKKLKCAQFCWTVLPYWYYEHVGNPAPTMKFPGQDSYPLILKWRPSARKRAKKQAGHEPVQPRLVLEELTADSFRRCPHKNSPLCMAQQAVVIAEFLSLKRHVFVHGDQARVFYLGERLAYQMLGLFYIPCPPPSPMAISDAEYQFWTAGYVDAQGNHQAIMPADTAPLRLLCTRERYNAYWRNASLGFFLDRRFKYRNAEYVNPTPLQDPSLLSAPGFEYGPEYQGSVQTQSVPDDLSAYMSSCQISYPGGDPVTIAPVPLERQLPPHASNDAWRELCTHEQEYSHGLQNFWYGEMEFAHRERDYERRCRARQQQRMNFYMNARDDPDGPCEPDVDEDSPPPTRSGPSSEATGSFIPGSSSTQYSQDLDEDY